MSVLVKMVKKLYGDSRKYDEIDRAIVLYGCLEDEARKFADGMSEVVLLDFDALADALGKRFDVTVSSATVMARMKAHLPTVGIGIREFVDELRGIDGFTRLSDIVQRELLSEVLVSHLSRDVLIGFDFRQLDKDGGVEDLTTYIESRVVYNPSERIYAKVCGKSSPDSYKGSIRQTRTVSMPARSVPHQETRTCHHCGKKGHVKAKCWKLHPELRPVKKEKTEQGN